MPALLVSDWRTARTTDIIASAEEQGWCARLVEDVLTHPGDLAGSAAIVAFDSADHEVEQLRLMKELSAQGSYVIALGSGASGWSIAVRSRALLAGARDFLDTAGRHWRREFAGILAGLVERFEIASQNSLHLVGMMRALGIEGTSPCLRAAFEHLARAAEFGSLPVLLLGDTGTGKELFAQALHKLDPKRRDGPMVAINCAAIPCELAESELFGHRSGAFTGASAARKGLLAAARGGVAFLDEVGDLPPTVQAKLLRAIETGRFMAVGDDHESHADVRFVAATNRDLGALASQGTFRQDLFHRIGVVTIRLPALSERREDIPVLVRRFAQCGSGADVAVDDSFIEALLAIPLPGNVRELRHLVSASLVNRAGPVLTMQALPAAVLEHLAAPAAPQVPAPALLDIESVLDRFDGRLEPCLNYLERTLIDAALVRAGGNQTLAARRLGVTPRSLYNKLHKGSRASHPEKTFRQAASA